MNIKYHKDTSKDIRIVGFEVEAKSIGWDKPCKNYKAFHTPEAYYMEDKEIHFTYEVRFEESKTLWAHRYDHYMKLGEGKVHHLQFACSALISFLFTFMVFKILQRTLNKDMEMLTRNVNRMR